MKKDYSQQEINEILLSKSLDDFYLAIIQQREESSVGEYSTFSPSLFDSESQKIFEQLSEAESLSDDHRVKDLILSFRELLVESAVVRAQEIIINVGDKIYVPNEGSFLDLQRWKVIHYEPITNYYNHTNAHIEICMPWENPKFCGDCVVMHLDDLSPYNQYGEKMFWHASSDDVTEDFLRETSQKKRYFS